MQLWSRELDLNRQSTEPKPSAVMTSILDSFDLLAEQTLVFRNKQVAEQIRLGPEQHYSRRDFELLHFEPRQKKAAQ